MKNSTKTVLNESSNEADKSCVLELTYSADNAYFVIGNYFFADPDIATKLVEIVPELDWEIAYDVTTEETFLDFLDNDLFPGVIVELTPLQTNALQELWDKEFDLLYQNSGEVVREVIGKDKQPHQKATILTLEDDETDDTEPASSFDELKLRPYKRII